MGRNCTIFATPCPRVSPGCKELLHKSSLATTPTSFRRGTAPKNDSGRRGVRLLWQRGLRSRDHKILRCFWYLYSFLITFIAYFFITYFDNISHSEFLCFCMNLLIYLFLYSFMYYLFRAKQNDMA